VVYGLRRHNRLYGIAATYSPLGIRVGHSTSEGGILGQLPAAVGAKHKDYMPGLAPPWRCVATGPTPDAAKPHCAALGVGHLLHCRAILLLAADILPDQLVLLGSG